MKRRELDSLDDEIRDHLERETRDNIERGMSPEDARLAALRKFGNVARMREETHDVWRMVWLDQLAQDVRYGMRVLLRNPRFTLVVVVTLALAIGMNTAVFSVVNAVLLRPLDLPQADRLVWLADYDPNIKRDFADLRSFEGWRALTSSYSAMAAYGYHQAVIGARQTLGEATSVYVAGDFWKLIGVRPALGRLCGPEETDCLVLSWDLFQRRLGGDTSAIGGPATVNGLACRLSAVLPPDFHMQLPMWWVADHPGPVDAFLPIPPSGTRMAQGASVFAALKAGVSREQARAELDAVHRRLVTERGIRAIRTRLLVEPLAQKLTGGSRRALAVLMAAAGLVLVIASLNVAGLLLARAVVRSKEVAIRMAIGAGRLRVLRQFLVESLLLALAGGGAGLLLAHWGIAIFVRVSPYAIPRLSEASIDLRVAAFALAASLASALLFGAGAAAGSLRADLYGRLKDGARLRTRRVLITAELALAIVPLAAAGLLWKSFVVMMQYPDGFAPARTVAMKVRFSGPAYRTEAGEAAYVGAVLRAVEATPGAQRAGVSNWIFYSGVPPFPADADPAATHTLRVRSVSRGYLDALGVSLVRGSTLPESGPSILLNESLAHQAFGHEDPIGRTFQLRLRRPFTVVGIVRDVRYSRLDADPIPEAYVSFQQMPPSFYLEIAARTSGDPDALALALQQRVSAIDPAQPVYEVKTVEQALADTVAPQRLNLFLLGSFAAISLALALVGIYGVMAYAVAARTREIGVRIALGAPQGQVMAMVAREAGAVAALGVVIGLVAAWGGTRIMAGLLYGVAPDDPVVFAASAIVLGAAAMAACIRPARAAAGIDPAVALRSE